MLRRITAPAARAAEIARRLGVTRSCVSAWLSGKRVPDLQHREALALHYSIPLDSWPEDRRAA